MVIVAPKIWLLAGIVSYLGLHVGILLVTAVTPLAFVVMGETNVEEIAEHCGSLDSLSHWIIGIGGITFFTSALATIATIATARRLRIVATTLLIINSTLALGLWIWGLIPTESRQQYFEGVWNDMKGKTRKLLQSYYSCCGFNSDSPRTFVDASCYADDNSKIFWPEGCYSRMTSVVLPGIVVNNSAGEEISIETSKFNPFAAAFFFALFLVIFVQLSTALLFIIGLRRKQSTSSQVSDSLSKVECLTVENKQATKYSSPEIPAEMSVSQKNIISISNQLDKQSTSSTSTVQDSTDSEKKPWYTTITDTISSSMESAFYFIGVKVAENPKLVIVLSLLLTGSIGVGFLQREIQASGSAGFLRDDQPVIQEFTAMTKAFPGIPRNHHMLVVDNNDVLQEQKYKAMINLHNRIMEFRTAEGVQFDSACLKVSGDCEQRSLFEFWDFNTTVLQSLSVDDVRTKVSEVPLVSPVFNDEVDISTILGSILKDGSGKISISKAHLMKYVTSRKNDEWEKEFIALGNSDHADIQVYVNAAGSRNFESSSTYQKELPLLFLGFCLIFVYIILMTGKFSLLEHRTYVALTGVTTAGLSLVAGIGLAASLGFSWSPIHLVGPFLIIGIGVDDMFIIIQAWNNVEDNPDFKNKTVVEKAGLALKTAGVSITVTSVTDLVAFAVGASSDLAAFASFSIYIALSIISLFVLQCTFFFACTVLDQTRREARYDACLACCYKHDESYKPGKCADRELFQRFFEDVLGKVLQITPVKIGVIILTLGTTSVMAYGFSNLSVNFDSDWYLPSDSYIHDYNKEYEDHFNPGIESTIYVINADFYAERSKLHFLYERLARNQGLDQKYLVSWFENYASWMATSKNISDVYADNAFSSQQQFYQTVIEYLTGDGRKYINDVSMRGGLMVGSAFKARHVAVDNVMDDVNIMDSLREDCAAAAFSDFAFPQARKYFAYTIIKVIQREVYKNLGITLLCVFIVVFPMIASLQMSFWVLVCVVFSIVDVAGSMYFAGLFIETSTIITLLLSVGLAVDYAAHIAHKFLILSGTRNMRMRVTLGQIGAAVFNGGFSTFLALVLLAGSDTYSYKVFFTVFVCVVGYGLWNGLVFLPCVLGLVGPPPHATAEEAKFSQRHQRQKCIEEEMQQGSIHSDMALERT